MALFDRFLETRLVYPVLALIVFLMALPGLFALPTMDRDEARFAQASAQMLETGDFVVIRYRDALRNKKPVGIHWLQAAAVGLVSTAQAREIAVYRLPSLLGAALAAMATFWGGAALFNRRAAFIGAALLASCLLLTTEAHIAKTDAALCGATALAMAALAQMRRGRGRWTGVIFWAAFAAGVLLKGPIILMVAGLTLVSLAIWERKAAWARPLLFWPGLSLFCVLVIPWFVAVEIATSGAFLKEAAGAELGGKLVGAAEGHNGPPGEHLADLALLFWPGTIFLIPGLALAIGSALRRPTPQPAPTRSGPALVVAEGSDGPRAWRFVVCWLVPSWLAFELAPTKLIHYTLPLYPALALIAGAGADAWLSGKDVKIWRFLSLALFAIGALLLAIAPTPWVLGAVRSAAAHRYGHALFQRVAFDWARTWNAAGLGFWPTILIALAVGATLYAFITRRSLALLCGLVACALAVGVSYRLLVLPHQSWTLSTPAALDALKELCAFPEDSAAWTASGCKGHAPKVVRAIGYDEPSLVFELAGKILLTHESKPVLPSAADDERPAWLFNLNAPVSRKALAQLTAASAASDRCIRFARRYAMDYSNGNPAVLLAVVVEPAGCPETSPPQQLRPSQDIAHELDK